MIREPPHTTPAPLRVSFCVTCATCVTSERIEVLLSAEC
jgi:hypothetical protein